MLDNKSEILGRYETCMRKYCAFLVVVLVSVSVAGGGDWPQWRYDAGGGAASPDELPAQLHLQWVRQLPQPRPAWPASQPWSLSKMGKLPFTRPATGGAKMFPGQLMP